MHTGFSHSFFRITDFNFNNRHDHKTAGRRAWLHHRWWWNPTLALCIYLCLTAAKKRLILQLVAQAAHEPVCDSPVEPCRICYKFKFRNWLFLTLKLIAPWKGRKIWRFWNPLQKINSCEFDWVLHLTDTDMFSTCCCIHLLTDSWFVCDKSGSSQTPL